jgi:virginiamycin B lyase
MRKSAICIGALALALAACSGHQSMPSPTNNAALAHGRNVGPGVVQTGHTPVQWTQFAWGGTSGTNNFNSAVTGSDGNVWYTDYSDNELIQMKMSGATHVFPLNYGSSSHFSPGNVAVGADGKFYMSTPATAGVIGLAKTTGSFSVINIPSGDQLYMGGMAVGSDGNIWYAGLKHIGKVTQTGHVTEFAYPDGEQNNYYGAVAAGSDGDIWVAEYNVGNIDEVDPNTGSITVYSLPCGLIGLVSAPDGNLYSSGCGNIYRITTSGSWTAIPNPFGTEGNPNDFVKGLDGNPWFSVSGQNEIATYNTSTNTLHSFYPPSTFGTNYGLTGGPDGNYWAIGNNAKIDVYIIDVITLSPNPIHLTSIGQTQTMTITEPNTSSWTVTSSSPGVATVTPVTGHPNQYTVKAVGVGNTNVTVKDAIGNSIVDKVTVT